MTTKNMVTKKMLMSVLLSLLLGGSLVQASKRAMSNFSGGPSGSRTREEMLAGESTGIAAATEELFAALFPTFALQEEGAFEAGSYFFQYTADGIILADETINLVCEQLGVVCTAEIVSEIQDVVQAVVKELLAMPEGWEIGVKSRHMAYGCAQQYLSSRELEVKLVFAALVDYLNSHFLSVMAWYGFNDDEKELARTHMPYAAFYEWEVALPHLVPTAVTREEREEHLLAPTENTREDVLTVGMLSVQTEYDWGIVSPGHKDVLAVLMGTNRKFGENDQQAIRRLFLEPTHLSFSFESLSDRNRAFFSVLDEVLAGMQHLTSLSLYGNGLGQFNTEQWRIVMDGLVRMQHLASLNLFCCDLDRFDADQLRIIMNCLAGMQHLTALNLYDNRLGELDAERLRIVMDGLAGMPHLTTLKLSFNSLYKLDVERLRIVMGGLAGMQNLTTLDLSGNSLYRLDADRLRIVMDGLASMQHLTMLNLFGNYLGGLDADRLRIMKDGLAGMQYLTKLNLFGNDLSDEVIQQLRERLPFICN